MINFNDKYLLNDGKKIPVLGFGTWRIPNGEDTYNAVTNAIKLGYRHIDTAKVYKNEQSVGKAVKDSGIKREDLFITTKLWNSDRGYDSTLKAFEESLKKLDMDYVDLYLMHWPAYKHQFNNWEQINIESFKAMKRLQEEGLIKSIGCSNFLPHHIKPLFDAGINPTVNQIEFHPGYGQFETVNYCQENHIVVEAWSPLGAGKMLSDEMLLAFAKKYNKSAAQICFNWCVQHNVLPLTRTTKVERMLENKDIYNFELEKEDILLIDKMERTFWSGNYPDTLDC